MHVPRYPYNMCAKIHLGEQVERDGIEMDSFI